MIKLDKPALYRGIPCFSLHSRDELLAFALAVKVDLGRG